MDGGIQALIISGVALAGGAIGWLSRQYWYHRAVKRQAVHDAGTTLKERKILLEEMLSKTEDINDKNKLIAQIDEVNAVLLGLHAERLRRTLKDAGFPSEEMLIADGRSQLQPQQARYLREAIAELETLPLPDSIRDLLILGDGYYHVQQYEDAKRIYDQILNLNPDDPDLLNNRGIIYRELERYEEALNDLNRSLQIRPNNPTVLMNRGNTYNGLGRHKEALNDLNRSLQIRPSHPATLSNRSIAYYYLERYEEALTDCNRSLELKPDDPDALGNRAIAYGHLERHEEALADFNRSLELRPDDPSTLYNLACLFSLWEKTDDSLAYLEKAIKGDEKNRKDAKTDKDFENIRDDPRFKKLTESD